MQSISIRHLVCARYWEYEEKNMVPALVKVACKSKVNSNNVEMFIRLPS